MTHPSKLESIKRRAFLRASGAMGMLAGAAPFALNLAAIGEVAAQTADDYKALVCVFLGGGNDHGNTVIPYDVASHNKYLGIRGALGYQRASLADTALNPLTPLPNNVQLALAPALLPLKKLFDERHLSVVLNVGTLVEPISGRAEFRLGSKALPPKLFSHNDQQSFWQAMRTEGALDGWGGRLGDVILGSDVASQSMFTAMSVSGSPVLLTGAHLHQFNISANGPGEIRGIKNNQFNAPGFKTALKNLIQQGGTHPIEQAHADTVRRSIAGNEQLKAALDSSVTAEIMKKLEGKFNPANPLATQLQMVTKLIVARDKLPLPARRQVFFVSLGGFDLHDGMALQHPVLLGRVAEAMEGFYRALEGLGLANSVTTFTGSDFGRTLAVNSDGSDHGWGSHHFVMGGAVAGQSFCGTWPGVSAIADATMTETAENKFDIGGGRLLPSTAVQQLVAPLARWFGVKDSDLGMVLATPDEFDLNALKLF